MTDITKKKEFLRVVVEKLRTVPENKMDYTAGVLDGMSIAYNNVFNLKAVDTPSPKRSA